MVTPYGYLSSVGRLDWPTVFNELALSLRRALELSEALDLRLATLDRLQEDQPVDDLAQRGRGQRALVGGVVPPVG